MLPNKNGLIESIKVYKEKINLLEDNIKKIIKFFKEIIKNLNTFHKINEDIINNYNSHKMNYEILYSLNNMKNISYKISELEYINKANINDKINSIFNIYYGMNIYEINIMYKVDKNEIRLFGNDFVQRYKNICKIIINGKEEELREFKTFSRFGKKIKQYEIKLHGIQNIDNLNHMFYSCESLLSLPDISKWNTSNITDMSYMFSWCKSLASSSLLDISKWNTSNVTDMSYMFNGCESLSSLPNISKWNTSNVTNMSYMFSGCKSLYSFQSGMYLKLIILVICFLTVTH